jgi:hypothetical protein
MFMCLCAVFIISGSMNNLDMLPIRFHFEGGFDSDRYFVNYISGH